MALDDRIREAFEQLATSLRQELDNRAAALARELTASADEERKALEAESLSRLAAEMAAARAAADARVAEERERASVEARSESAAERQRLQEDMDRQRAELERLQADAERLRVEADRAREELESARASARESGAELAAARSAAEQSSAELTSARASLDSLRSELEAERRRADALAEQSAGALERAAAAEKALGESRGGEAAERQDHMAGLDRLSAALRRIGEAGTLGEVLGSLADAAASEASRSAVLVASPAGDSYQILRASGFQSAPQDSIPREAADNFSRGLPFAPLPPDRAGHTVPIEIGRKAVALLYGDDGDSAPGRPHVTPSAWPEALEILARHASLRLEAITARRTVQALSGQRGGSTTGTPVATIGSVAGAAARQRSSTENDQSARRYARLLVSEIKLYNETAVRLGREHRDLLERLRSEIARARRLYEERVPATVAGRAAYFDDEIVQILADGDPGSLGGRDPSSEAAPR